MIAKNDNYGRPLFAMGQIVATPAALAALEKAHQNPAELLKRHQSGNWGEVGKEDAQTNDAAVIEGLRVMSVYTLKTGVKIWIITEADRSSTTCLLPDEY